MSCFMRKHTFSICLNKGADQLCGKHTADQHLCFSFIDSTTPPLYKSKSQASGYILWLYNHLCVIPGNPIDSFLMMGLKR